MSNVMHRAGRIDGTGTRHDSLTAAADWLRLEDRPASTPQKRPAGWDARGALVQSCHETGAEK
jgi:hypothetical protein